MVNKNESIDFIQSYYTSCLDKSNLAESAGRNIQSLGSGKHIWNDIKQKLDLRQNSSFLDIGCGFGEVTLSMLRDTKTDNISLTLIDSPEIIQKIKETFTDILPNNTFFVPGYFPENKASLRDSHKFDCIVSYSVLQYAKSPIEFIENAVALLAPGGKFLLGDFANVNKKGRFLSTVNGRKFDAEYKNIDIKKVPAYKDQYDFIDTSINHIKHINDELLLQIMKEYRHRGYDVYVLPQLPELPFSKTREDILICAPF